MCLHLSVADVFGRKNNFAVMSYCDLSSANPDCAKSIEGMKREPSSRAVHSEYGMSCEAFCGAGSWDEVREVPLVTGANACFEARKLERRALISSTFDFSEAGRRIIEGPPFMILLQLVSDCVLLRSRGSCTRLIG